MRALILTHHPSEGPGSIGTFLTSRGVLCQTVPLFDGAQLPSDALGYDAIISMGGPMNVYEEDKYPFLKTETRLLKKALELKIPILGVCLGAQMLAKAAGARVVKSPHEEVGWFKIRLTDLGRLDRLFLGTPSEFEVFQWHGDMFEIPVGGGLLASSDLCPHQSIRFGSGYGLQFHVEVTRNMLSEWFAQTPEQGPILERMDMIQKGLSSCANVIFTNFLNHMKRSQYAF
ncbi:MAG: type 1 glutamine amidotransferase [Desulfomonilaceae bacterium]